MSALTITEYANVLPNGVFVEPAIATQSVTFTATSVQSSAFDAKTRFVRLSSDATCTVIFGTNPTAVTATANRLLINTPSVHYVGNGAALKVAVVT